MYQVSFCKSVQIDEFALINIITNSLIINTTLTNCYPLYSLSLID